MAPASSRSALILSASSFGRVLLDDLRGRFDEILGFLETQDGDLADDLDHLDLLLAGVLEDDVELRLFLSGSGCGAGRRPAIMATGAAAVTPNFTSNALMKPASSSRFHLLILSRISCCSPDRAGASFSRLPSSLGSPPPEINSRSSYAAAVLLVLEGGQRIEEVSLYGAQDAREVHIVPPSA